MFRITVIAIVFAVLPPLFAAEYASHPPMRPLQGVSNLPVKDGPAFFADPVKGHDKNDGTKERPWRTIQHALTKLKPGDTLLLRGGVYFESIDVKLQGADKKPITIRSMVGELAIIDGGFREFQENPAQAWEPVSGGAKDEFRSTKTYPEIAKGGRRGVALLGNFADSMVPLHGYRFVKDFRSDNPYWNFANKLDENAKLYNGPGVWFDYDTQRMHVRLSHTRLNILGKQNYRGETDPRKLPLVIAAHRPVVRLSGARNVLFEDFVIRGSAGATVHIENCQDIAFDNVTINGGAPAMHVRGTSRLRLSHSALRGLSAPWSSRASHKYRGNSPYLFIATGDEPQNRDFEFAHCEFTDNHDGLIIGTIKNLEFHHNLVDNFDDDGLYLTLSRKNVPEGIHIHENQLGHCLSLFAFAQSGPPLKNPLGPGVFISGNVIDLRRGTLGWPPKSADDDNLSARDTWERPSRVAGDHGGPAWEPINFYHNTVIMAEAAWRGYYGGGWGGHTANTQRRVFNNIFVHLDGMPGLNFSGPDDDLHVDGNLHWSVKTGPEFQGDFFATFRNSKVFTNSKKRYPPGWTTSDRFVDPKFLGNVADLNLSLDVRIAKDSPARDAGVPLPAGWRNLREDTGKPDIGALPVGAKMFKVGRQ